MKTGYPLFQAKMSFYVKRSTCIYFILIFLTLTAKVLTQSNDKLSVDAEQRRAKLRSLLGRSPPSTSALLDTEPQTVLSTLSQDSLSSTTESFQSTKNDPDFITEAESVTTNEEEERLIDFLESRNDKTTNETSIKELRDRNAIGKLQRLEKGCNFESSSGTLNCKDGLEFFDIISAYKQTIQIIQEQSKENDIELSRIDIFSCSMPIIFSFDHNDSSSSNGEEIYDIKKGENVKTIAIVHSNVENIEEGAFDNFMETLIQLDLSSNKLDRIPSAIFRLKNLIDLNLSGNQISQLPALPKNLIETGVSFRNLVMLSSLNLGNNRLGVENKKFSSLQLKTLKEFEPLAKTLYNLKLNNNGFQSLPELLQGNKTFYKLRSLDISHNAISEIPLSAFSNLPELTELNIEHCRLQTLKLTDKTAMKINILLMEGNPLKCDCESRWLWNMINLVNGRQLSSIVSVTKRELMKHNGWNLPRCSTPFSVKNNKLGNLKESDFCHLATKKTTLAESDSLSSLGSNDITRKPRFFRVSPADELSFPKNTFTSLSVDKVEAILTPDDHLDQMSEIDIQISWSISKTFYDTDYDWAIIYRKIGDVQNPNMFYKTPYSLQMSRKAEDMMKQNLNSKYENMTGTILAKQDTFYELCLSVVDEEAVLYYLHSNHCKEVRTPKLDIPQNRDTLDDNQNMLELNLKANNVNPSRFRDDIKTTNISVSSNSESITVSWQVLLNEENRGSNSLLGSLSTSKEGPLEASNEVISLIRKISLRPFSSENSTKLFVLEDFNRTQWNEEDKAPIASRYYTLSNLQPNTPYVVCFETLPPPLEHSKRSLEAEARKSGKSLSSWHESEAVDITDDSVCMETTTANINITSSVSDFPVTEVAAATAVSTTTTAFVIAIICCCCPASCKRRRSKGKSKNSEDRDEDVESNPSKDENENKLDSYEAKKLRAHLRKHSSPARSVHSSTTGCAVTSSYAEQELLKNDCNRSSTTSDSEIQKLSHNKFQERYPNLNHCPQHNRNIPESIMKTSNDNSGPGLKFWKSCLSSSVDKNIRDSSIENHSDNNERQRVQIATISSSSACSEINIEESEIDNEDDVQLEETERGIQIKEDASIKEYNHESNYERSNEEIIVNEPPIVAQNINMGASTSFLKELPHTTHSLPRVKMHRSKTNSQVNHKNVESRGTQVKTSHSLKHSGANTDLTSEIECNGDCCNEHSTVKYPNYFTLPHPGSLHPPPPPQSFPPRMMDNQKRSSCNQMVSRPLPPPRFLPNGTLLPMYDSRRDPPSTSGPTPSAIHLHQGHHRSRALPLDPASLGPGSYATIANYQFYKRPVPMEYYTPPQPDYYRVLRPNELSGQLHPTSHPVRLMNNLDYSAQTLGRTKKEAKAMGSFVRTGNNNYHQTLLPNQHMSPHQHQVNQALQQQQFGEKMMRASKLKKFLLKHNIAPGSNQNPHINSNEQFKMYTWSPYNNNDSNPISSSHCGQHPNNGGAGPGLPSSSSVYVHPHQIEPFVPVHHSHPAAQQAIPSQSSSDMNKSAVVPGPMTSEGKNNNKRGNRKINELRF